MDAVEASDPDASSRTAGDHGARRLRLLLVRHAPTAATRRSSFPIDEPLDDPGRAAAGRLAARLPRRIDGVSSPARRCRETAEAAAISVRTEPSLRECDFGAWSGKSLTQVLGSDPDGASRWMADPSAAPHGGESLACVAGRVGAWLDSIALSEGVVAAITHGEVVKAAILHALGAPLMAFWRIDVDPLSITELSCHDGCWTMTRTNSGERRRR